MVFEFRFYKSGWTLQLWRAFIRWENQYNYKSINFSFVGQHYKPVGGTSLKEYWANKKAQERLTST